MDESSLESSINEYKEELSQIQALISTSDDLTKLELYDLEKDLMELVTIAEERLLDVKKRNLLAMLSEDGGSSDITPKEESSHVIKNEDDESSHVIKNEDDESSHVIKNEDDDETVDDNTDIQSDLVGVKCRVKYTQEWGSFQYHNAMVLNCDIDESLGDSQVNVHVLFLNPIHISMVPCKYFLNGNCDYDATCKYSHGYVVDIEELEEYEEPDFTQLHRKCKCLAKYEDDGVWYPATVVSIQEEQATVSFDTYKETLTLDFHSILPLASYVSDSSSEDDEIDDTDEQICFSELSYKTASMSGPMGDWEKHTKGVGSMIMQKMGYIFGKGLGKEGQGKIEPVEIRLLPPGKSLDYIAELREKGKIKDPTKTKNKINKSENTEKDADTAFDVINRLMHSGSKIGNVKEFRESSSKFSIEDSYKSLKRHMKTKHVGDAKISRKNKDTKINIEMFKVSEKVTALKKQLTLQKEALSRNPGESSVSRRIKQNIEATENEIDELKKIDESLQNKLQMKKQSKKLSVF